MIGPTAARRAQRYPETPHARRRAQAEVATQGLVSGPDPERAQALGGGRKESRADLSQLPR